MGWKDLTQETAAKFARRAQWLFALAGAGAVALAVLGTKPRPTESLPPLEIPAPTAAKPGGEEASRSLAFDAKAIATRFDHLGNRPKPAPKADETPGAETPVEHVPTADALKFLGVLREPGRLVALLKIGEKQRLLGPGEASGDIKVIEVTETHATVSENGAQKKLELQARTGPAVTVLAAGGPAATGFNPGAPRGQGQPNSGNQVPDQKTILERRERAMREAADAQARMEAEGGPVRPKPLGGDKR